LELGEGGGRSGTGASVPQPSEAQAQAVLSMGMAKAVVVPSAAEALRRYRYPWHMPFFIRPTLATAGDDEPLGPVMPTTSAARAECGTNVFHRHLSESTVALALQPWQRLHATLTCLWLMAAPFWLGGGGLISRAIVVTAAPAPAPAAAAAQAPTWTAKQQRG
jgi:hypothetical protein